MIVVVLVVLLVSTVKVRLTHSSPELHDVTPSCNVGVHIEDVQDVKGVEVVQDAKEVEVVVVGGVEVVQLT